MLTFLDVMERATTGPIITEDDFNLKVLVANVRKIVKQYDIRYDAANPVTTDDALAQRLFDAAVQFIADTGLYCTATNRVIRVERDEILRAVKEISGGGTFGEGKDRRMFQPRRPEDPTPPWCHVGTGIVASSEEIAMAQVEGYGSIRQANSVSIPAFGRARGMPVLGGSPLEIYASAASVQAARKALWQCGRSWLPILNLISSATTAMATLAASHPAFGLRASDGWLIDFIAEMKVNYETLNRLAFILITGGNVGSTCLPILGGYGGGAPGTALIMTAYHLLGMLLFQGSYQLTGPVHFKHSCSTTRDGLWIFSVVGRATSLHTRYPAIALGYGAAGPCTKMYFYESAAVNLACVASGFAGVQTVHPAKAIITDGVTPLEAQFNVAMALAATGISAARANELVNQLLAKYETEIERAPEGKRYQECFDVATRKPSEEYVRLYDQVKEELTKMGLEF